MVGNTGSYLAKQSDLVINTTVENEASPGNPAPTCSTTAQLVMGDALAMAVLNCRGFLQMTSPGTTPEDLLANSCTSGQKTCTRRMPVQVSLPLQVFRTQL